LGDGTQSRSCIYVPDVVGAITRPMYPDQAVGQVCNIGNGKEITMTEPDPPSG